MSKEDFKNKIENDEMVEHNNYVGNYYGIEKNKLVEALIKNEVVFTQIEVNGKHNLDKQGIKHLAIFLLPDSLDNLADRIRKRKGVSEEKIKERLETAKQEIEKSVDYDYKIVNKEGELADTITKVRQIIEEKLSIDKKD